MTEGNIFSIFSETENLGPRVQRQLLDVYLTLTLNMACCIFGCYVASRVPALGDYGLFTFIAAAAGAMAIYLMAPIKQNLQKRCVILWSVSWLVGTLLQNAIEPLMYYGDEAIVYTALGSTLTLFASFSIATMISSRRRVIYLLGAATFTIASLSWVSLLTFFYPTRMLNSFVLLIGLATACISVVVHTRNILDEARMGGDLDPVTHSLQLFGDALTIFIRLIVLLSNEKRRREEDGNGKHNKQRQRGRSGCRFKAHPSPDTSFGKTWSINF
ncbi:Inhibitor of apoptosis-promoting Bax1-related protein [Coemansia spiralis]|uniref:Inhibitor of apoptosis-promoting Bax1-related protein n=2 Tax=Coemansia TaxID=4863 RepID=A0A9W8FY81_9FUNG|nr:hypothetical protein BX070DRAFT_228277 [Coemansia spiralis]KAJ1992030.1 Inhibitor of apoptosis-promoting Bax1-related protein [Coemansia umbellata]KAJ2621351.1 Inhibitor of apoptosis-promoting Bax1-related protein [Coemansia sp. RSA 1358]KAJ2670897.1 Inhibitor of apoptosis-promoting Bax1-related protein [Coemansia spiralis]